nr:MAG TPA: hypothetical protein [Crassvirales sp.]
MWPLTWRNTNIFIISNNIYSSIYISIYNSIYINSFIIAMAVYILQML